jgi:hypothetical protein
MNNTESLVGRRLVYLLYVGSPPRSLPYYKKLFGVFSTQQAANEVRDTLKTEEYPNSWKWVEVWNMDTLPRRYRNK